MGKRCLLTGSPKASKSTERSMSMSCRQWWSLGWMPCTQTVGTCGNKIQDLRTKVSWSSIGASSILWTSGHGECGPHLHRISHHWTLQYEVKWRGRPAPVSSPMWNLSRRLLSVSGLPWALISLFQVVRPSSQGWRQCWRPTAATLRTK